VVAVVRVAGFVEVTVSVLVSVVVLPKAELARIEAATITAATTIAAASVLYDRLFRMGGELLISGHFTRCYSRDS
jgi:hypothetical protein